MENNENQELLEKDIIKHIVISGGGIIGFSQYGVLRESNQRGLWSIDNIESIYGTSAGAIIGVIICLKYDWETINDYIIKRPWQNVFKIKVEKIFESYSKKGIFDLKTIYIFFYVQIILLPMLIDKLNRYKLNLSHYKRSYKSYLIDSRAFFLYY